MPVRTKSRRAGWGLDAQHLPPFGAVLWGCPFEVSDLVAYDLAVRLGGKVTIFAAAARKLTRQGAHPPGEHAHAQAKAAAR